MTDRRPGTCMRTREAARDRSLSTASERSRGPGCHSVGTLADPSPPPSGFRSPWGRSGWPEQETSRDGAGPPGRVVWWWDGAGVRRAGCSPTRVHASMHVGIGVAAASGSPWCGGCAPAPGAAMAEWARQPKRRSPLGLSQPCRCLRPLYFGRRRSPWPVSLICMRKDHMSKDSPENDAGSEVELG